MLIAVDAKTDCGVALCAKALSRWMLWLQWWMVGRSRRRMNAGLGSGKARDGLYSHNGSPCVIAKVLTALLCRRSFVCPTGFNFVSRIRG